MMMMKDLLVWLGLAPSKRDKELRELVENSYKSLEVVGRGLVRIDPEEVRRCPIFNKILEDIRSAK